MKKIRQLKFTLMEVTVAFGIFAILVAVLMQFLNTAQRSWNFAEKRARAYADSRILFDLMDKALNTAFSGNVFSTFSTANENGIRFHGVLPYRYQFHANNGTNGTSSETVSRNGVNVSVNAFLDENVRKVRNMEFEFVLPPATPTATPAANHGTVGIDYDSLAGTAATRRRDIVIANVTDFNVNMLSSTFGSANGNNQNRPAFVVVSLRMFGSEADYDTWITLSEQGSPSPRENYFCEHGFTFTRMFTLPRGQ